MMAWDRTGGSVDAFVSGTAAIGMRECRWGQGSPGIAGSGVLLQVGWITGQGAGRLTILHVFVLSCPKAAWSPTAGCCIPCALLTEILIHAIRKVKNKEFQHGSHFVCALQWVLANSSAVVSSAWNPAPLLRYFFWLNCQVIVKYEVHCCLLEHWRFCFVGTFFMTSCQQHN